MNSKVLVILGTTASGKTKLAVKLAKKFKGEIISADSRQIYQGMDIGTGKDLKDYGSVPYHLISIVSPKKYFSVADWQQAAYQKIDQILKKNKLPVVVGGTGLYISALVNGYDLATGKIDLKLRKKLDQLTLKQLSARLKSLDLAAYRKVDKKNRRRVQRALEIYYQEGQFGKRKNIKPPYEFLQLGLTLPKEELKNKISRRLKQRLDKQGMVKEVEKLHASGLSWKALDNFGLEYRFISRYLRRQVSYEEMVVQLEKAIIAFAKRQMTWFKRDKSIKWVKSYPEAMSKVKVFINKK